MLDPGIREDLLRELEVLGPEMQRRVIEFVRRLRSSAPRGVRGSELLRFSGVLSAEEGEQMRRAIEEGCGRVDADGW